MITHIWQSTLFAGMAGLLTLLLRRNRARTRYWVWLAGLVKFLAPFGVLVNLGGHINPPRWTPGASAIVEPAISFVMGGDIGGPRLTTLLVAQPNPNNPLPAILFSIWACGFVAIVFCWVGRWIQVRADVRAASPLPITIEIPVVCSPTMREPGVFGIFRPVLLLPKGVEQHLSSPEWKCILAHELCHARCYDNLTAAIYMLIQAIFWFHPLVWWLGNKLVTERELACDEEVLRLGSEPKVYAEGILKVCELYLESPLTCVAGVTGSNLRRRIRAIMTQRGTERMNSGKKLLLVAAGMVAITAPIVIGVLNAPQLRAQSAAAVAPKFEVASIRVSKNPEPGGNIEVTPGRFRGKDLALQWLILTAYRITSDKLSGDLPNWTISERYDIDAKTGDSSGEDQILLAMQALLQERFKLRLHREMKDESVYFLTVGKNGIKMPPGSCVRQEGLPQ
jgi:bla regulator protein BlaR1